MANTHRPCKHGTVGGYQCHKRRREPACAPCIVAWRVYYQKRNGSLPLPMRRQKQKARKRAQELGRKHGVRDNLKLGRPPYRTGYEPVINKIRREQKAERERNQDSSKRVEVLQDLPTQD